MTYAYICPTCGHPQSRHLLIGTTIEKGPFQCHYGDGQMCGCEITLRGPSIRVNRAEFQRRFPYWPQEPT